MSQCAQSNLINLVLLNFFSLQPNSALLSDDSTNSTILPDTLSTTLSTTTLSSIPVTSTNVPPSLVTLPPPESIPSLPPLTASSIITSTTTETIFAKDRSEDGEDYANGEDEEEEEEDDGDIVLQEDFEPTAADFEKGFCVLDNRVTCGEGGFSGDLGIPCARNTRPQPIKTPKEMSILKEVCPEFVNDLPEGEMPSLCCDLKGLRELQRNYEMPKQMGLARCPSCFYNFRRIFCNSACSPVQSKFLRIDSSTPVPVGNWTLQQVQQMTYFIERRFADGLYESCKSKFLSC